MKSYMVLNIFFLLYTLATCAYIYDYIDYKDLGIEYKFHEHPAFWVDAFKICKKEYASLAMPRNREEAKVLVSLFDKDYRTGRRSTTYNYMSLGFHDKFNKFDWVTLDDEQLFELDYFWGETTGQRCGGMDYTGAFTDISCNEYKHSFACQRRYRPIEVHYNEKIDYPLHQDFQFVYPPYSFYKFHSNAEKFSDARAICHAEGGYLAVIKNEQEWDFVHKTLFEINDFNTLSMDIFIGFHDYFKEGEFVSVLGELMSDFYQRWTPGNPHGTSSKNCIIMNAYGDYQDVSCDKRHPFICQRDIYFDNHNVTTQQLDLFGLHPL